MKLIFKFITLTLFISTFLISGFSQDKFRVSVTYNRTDFPLYDEDTEVKNINGITIEGDARLIKFGEYGRVSVAYDFNRKFDQEVFPSYRGIFDIYRDVNTHSIGGQIGYAIHGSVEPFAGLFYGARKIHEDAPFQLVRTVRLGLNVPFSKKSPFFLKGYLNYEQPYGELPIGFINPYNRTLGFGGGFRF